MDLAERNPENHAFSLSGLVPGSEYGVLQENGTLAISLYGANIPTRPSCPAGEAILVATSP